MDILVIGGTVFLGRATVEAALAAGHNVTLFNRGKTNPDLFPDVEKLRGDRGEAEDLAAFAGRRWDAVIDTSGYVPRVVKLSADALADKTDHYTFISTISVYEQSAIFSTPNLDENGPLATLEDEKTEEVTGATYGGLKALCEQAAAAAMPGRVLTIRPGLIVGPHDPTDRFSYWPVKMARGGELLAPPEDSPLQIIDVRDLAEWNLRIIKAGKTGIYNATGPDYALTFGTMLTAAREAIGDAAASPVFTDEAFLLENEVQPWADLPLWLPAANQAMSQVNVSKAIDAGLTFRSMQTTTRDILDWYDLETPLKTGISPEREAELLKKWQVKQAE